MAVEDTMGVTLGIAVIDVIAVPVDDADTFALSVRKGD